MTTVNVKGTLALTPKGSAKIAGLLAAAMDGAQVGMFFAVEKMRARAAEVAPNPNEEEAILSSGTAVDQWYTGEIGSPWSLPTVRPFAIVSSARRARAIAWSRASVTKRLRRGL